LAEADGLPVDSGLDMLEAGSICKVLSVPRGESRQEVEQQREDHGGNPDSTRKLQLFWNRYHHLWPLQVASREFGVTNPSVLLEKIATGGEREGEVGFGSSP